MKPSRVGFRSVLLAGATAVLGAALVVVPVSSANAASASGGDGLLTGSLGSVVIGTGSASSGSHRPPPYIESAQWFGQGGESVLKITPTEAGRTSWGVDDEAVAWAEVVALAPDATSPGMRQQFACHWVFARVAEPDKPTWNLEPWRPVVPDAEMIAARCNPTTAGSSSGSLS